MFIIHRITRLTSTWCDVVAYLYVLSVTFSGYISLLVGLGRFVSFVVIFSCPSMIRTFIQVYIFMGSTILSYIV